MRKTDFLDAVGKTDPKYLEECVTWKRSSVSFGTIWKIGAAAACLALILTGVFLIPGIIGKGTSVVEENGFYIENGTLLRYEGGGTDITVPDQVTTIGASAFSYSKSPEEIRTIRLGTNVSEIDADALAGLDNLVSFVVSESNGSYVWEDGLLLSADGTELIRYDREGETSFTIPDTVRTVGACAVQGTQLEEIVFGRSLEYIGYGAFSGNDRLKAIILPDSVKTVREEAFSGCTSAVDGSYPSDAVIGEGAFEYCPFYLSKLAGRMCPAEEVIRGTVTPSEAVLRSDTGYLEGQINGILSALRGEPAPFSEISASLPEIPDGVVLPEEVTLGDLQITDSGWGNTGGIYDAQITVAASGADLIMEVHAGMELQTGALEWKDVRFRVERVYFAGVSVADPEDTVTAYGWTAVFEKQGGLYTGITFSDGSGTLIRSMLPTESPSRYVLLFSPDGTKVAVEYTGSDGMPCFFVQSLNGEKLAWGIYDFTEYLNGYFGAYTAGSLRWSDSRTLEGENEYGHFTFDIFELKPVQEYDPKLTDPDNRDVVSCDYGSPYGYGKIDVPAIWRHGYGTVFYDTVREAAELEAYRMNLPADDPPETVIDDQGSWSVFGLEGSGLIDPSRTMITDGTNRNGVDYLILETELETYLPQTEHLVFFRGSGSRHVCLSIKVITYEGEDAEAILGPIIESVTCIIDQSQFS